MDRWYDGSANIELAHRERRRAARLLKAQRFDEAIAAHREAVLQLEKVLLLARDSVVRESLELQIVFHGRQQAVVAYLRERQRSLLRRQPSVSFSRTTADTVELAEMALPDFGGSFGIAGSSSCGGRLHANSTSNYQQLVQTTLDQQTDILLRLANSNRTAADNNTMQQLQQHAPAMEADGGDHSNSDTAAAAAGNSNDAAQLVSELVANNSELRRLVDSLLGENHSLEQRNRELIEEVDKLRAKVRELEDLQKQTPQSGGMERDSSKGTGLDSTAAQQNPPASPLMPDLAPLEIPDFDNFPPPPDDAKFR